MESRFHYITIMFCLCEPFGRLVVGWGGSVTDHHKLLLFNQTYVLGNVRPELFFFTIVVGHLCLCCFYFLQQIFMLLFTLPFFFLFFFFKGIFHLGVLICRTHTSHLHVIYRMGVRLLFFICWMQFWDYEHLMYTLNILLLNVTGWCPDM